MNDDLHNDALATLSAMDRPAPHPGARNRTRAAFVHGRRHRLSPLAWIAPALASSLAAIVYVEGTRPAEMWRIIDLRESEPGVTAAAAPERGIRIEQGVIETPDDYAVEIGLGTDLRLLLSPDTRVLLARPPGRWFHREAALVLESGEIRSAASGGKPALPLSVQTGEASVRIDGATFAVTRHETATRVLVFDGYAEVSANGGEAPPVRVDRGMQCHLFGDGRPAETEPIANPADIMHR